MADLKKRIMTAVAEDLARIEEALVANLNPHFELVRETAGHLLFSGGKRLRPLLMVLGARLCGRDDDFVTRLSVIVEYLHAATLLHDDVVDGADLRRGQTVTNQVWDAPTAVLTGDFLLARALSLASESQDPAVIATIASITELMSQGEIQQLADRGNVALSEAQYMETIRCKTAVLIEGSCRVGAMLAGADAQQIEAVASYGTHVGLVFQMADDLLDYTADSQGLGKATGADLREGKLTLPVIRSLAVATGTRRERMLSILATDDFTPALLDEFAELLEGTGGLDYTREKARTLVERARASLAAFPDTPARKVMEDIADYAFAREI